MDVFGKRPFALCCFSAMIAAVASLYLNMQVKLIAAAVVAAGAVALLLAVIFCGKRNLKIKLSVALTAAVFAFAAIAVSFVWYDVHASRDDAYIGNDVTVTATVVSKENHQEDNETYYIRVTEINGARINAKAVLKCGFQAGLEDGSTVTFGASCVDISEVAYSGNVLPLTADGITAAFVTEDDSAGNMTVLKDAGRGPEYYLGETGNKLNALLSEGIGGESGKLASALLLGRTEGLSDTTRRDFSRSGISHTLALSGLHITILAGFFAFIAKAFFVPKKVRSALLPVVLTLYLFLTGFRLPTLRASMMLTAVAVSFLFKRKSDALTVLSATGAGILILIPASAADAGFLMSFLAAFAIIVSAPYIERLFSGIKPKGIKRILRYIASSLLVTLAANAAVLYLSRICFGELSLAAPAANMLTAPAVAALLVFSILFVALGWIPALGNIVSACCGFFGNYVLGVTSEISKLKNVCVSLEYPFSDVIIILASLSLAVLLVIKLRRKIFVLVPPAAAVTVFAVCLLIFNAAGNGKPAVTYLCRGESEMLVMTENGRAVIFDVSDGSYTNIYNAYAAACSECATETEALVLTQYKDRHRRSVKKFAESERLRSLWLPEPANRTDYLIMKELFETSAANGVECYVYRDGEALEIFGGTRAAVDYGNTLKRSSVASVSVTAENGGEIFEYVGSAFYETTGAFPPSAPAALVIYGTRGPNPGIPYPVRAAEELAFADETLAGLARTPSEYPPERVFVGCGYKKFVFGRIR